MPKKLPNDVLNIVMAYGPDPRNTFLDDPQGDPTKAVNPALATMPQADFDAFFNDFNQYIRVDNAMPTVIMSPHALKNCPDWATLAVLVFNSQV
jgi:hypothetical protein